MRTSYFPRFFFAEDRPDSCFAGRAVRRFEGAVLAALDLPASCAGAAPLAGFGGLPVGSLVMKCPQLMQ
jgi:hypothetical protein